MATKKEIKTEGSITPTMTKNEGARMWECYTEDGAHLVVTFEEFAATLAERSEAYQRDMHMDQQAAETKAWFELVDSTFWHNAKHTHDCAAHKEATLAFLNRAQKEMPHRAGVFTADLTHFFPVEEGPWGPENPEEDDPLKAMERYFYGLYRKMETGSVEEARAASLYVQIRKARAHDRIAVSLRSIDAHGVF